MKLLYSKQDFTQDMMLERKGEVLIQVWAHRSELSFYILLISALFPRTSFVMDLHSMKIAQENPCCIDVF